LPFNPAGVYTLPNGYAGVDGQTILTSQHNPPLEDIQAALSLTLLRDGRAPMTANLNMNTFKAINLANGTTTTDAVNKSQLDGAITFPSSNSFKFTVGNFLVQSASTATTTNAGGSGVITYPTSYTSAPTIIACSGDAAFYNGPISIISVGGLTGFTFLTNPALISGAIRVNWVVLGSVA
jgi:hypothetical protein